MVLEYVGTKYDGWQKQGNTKNTIQGKVENILTQLANKTVEVSGSGRTDKGVHARAQVASFKLDEKLPCDKIKNYLNKYLPLDIKVNSVSFENERFHARLNAKTKTYEYKIANVEKAPVFESKYCAYIEEKLDLNEMAKAAEYFLGKHDFLSFCSNKRYKKSTVREIYDIKIERTDVISIKICGNGFLHNMVRIIVGTIVEVGMGKLKAEIIPEIFEKKDRQGAGYTMPPHGLTLIDVTY